MRNQRKNYFVKPGFQTKLTLIILLIVVIVANIVGGVIYGLLSGSVVIEQFAKILEVENQRDLLLPVILFSELVAIIIVTFIGIFVSHTMAGPIYRFEMVLEDLANGELDSHFHLRTSDEFHELADGFNDLIASLNSKVSEMKVYVSNLNNVMGEISTPKDITVYDIDNIKETLSKLSVSVNFFKMVEPAGDSSSSPAIPSNVVAANVETAPQNEIFEENNAKSQKVSSEDLINDKKNSKINQTAEAASRKKQKNSSADEKKPAARNKKTQRKG